jgi:hypothetical protein
MQIPAPRHFVIDQMVRGYIAQMRGWNRNATTGGIALHHGLNATSV